MLFNMISITSCCAFDSCERSINDDLLLCDRRIYRYIASSSIAFFSLASNNDAKGQKNILCFCISMKISRDFANYQITGGESTYSSNCSFQPQVMFHYIMLSPPFHRSPTVSLHCYKRQPWSMTNPQRLLLPLLITHNNNNIKS